MTQRLDYAGLAAGAMRGFESVHAYLHHASIPKPLLDLVFLRVSQINGCAYCIDTHGHDLIAGGEQPERVLLTSAWREAGEVFSAREQAALAWAESVTRVPETRVPDADYAAASAVFSGQELADLTVAVALMNAYNRLAIPFRTPPAHVTPAAG